MAILGIDEAGRGPWAGPLVVGAVILADPAAEWCAELNDSKKLTVKKREKLTGEIREKAAAVGLGWVPSAELDEVGMSRALRLAVRRAVEEVQGRGVPFHEIIIDGPVNFLAGTALEKYVTTLPKADALIKEVSAASIVAKVARDKYMDELAGEYPEYGFEKHKGYGTALHRARLEEFGICPEHRRSFRPVKEIMEREGMLPEEAGRREILPEEIYHEVNNYGGEMRQNGAILGKNGDLIYHEMNNSREWQVGKKNTTEVGKRAETVVAEYLERNGHRIVARNYKTRFYEIDIVSILDDKIYFTEVKYRRDAEHGEPLEAVTAGKLEQMKFAAEAFLKFYERQTGRYQPQLAVAGVSGADFRLEKWFAIG